MMLSLHHLAVLAHDVQKVSVFYRDVLGLPEQARHRSPDGSLRSVWLSLGNGGFLAVEVCVGSVEPSGFRTDEPGWLLVSLRIPRHARAQWLERLAAHGVKIERESRWTVYFRDPEGNRVALSHHPEDPTEV